MRAGVAETEEEEQEGAFRPFAQQGRTGCCRQHQHIRIKLATQQAGDSMRGNVPAAGDVRQDVQHNI
jgi:hypothetical protein